MTNEEIWNEESREVAKLYAVGNTFIFNKRDVIITELCNVTKFVGGRWDLEWRPHIKLGYFDIFEKLQQFHLTLNQAKKILK
jgi:hypothetical protein